MVSLIVVAHPDDEILGFGGTGAKLVQKGEIIQPIILCGNVVSKQRYTTVQYQVQSIYTGIYTNTDSQVDIDISVCEIVKFPLLSIYIYIGTTGTNTRLC